MMELKSMKKQQQYSKGVVADKLEARFCLSLQEMVVLDAQKLSCSDVRNTFLYKAVSLFYSFVLNIGSPP